MTTLREESKIMLGNISDQVYQFGKKGWNAQRVRYYTLIMTMVSCKTYGIQKGLKSEITRKVRGRGQNVKFIVQSPSKCSLFH